MSKVEEQILSREFDYLHPYFYNNPYALRCELGIGNTTEEYLSQARQRANAIYDILFSHGTDAIISITGSTIGPTRERPKESPGKAKKLLPESLIAEFRRNPIPSGFFRST